MLLYVFFLTGLNDRDLIGIGGKYTVAEAKGEKYIFLYRVHAPSNWGEELPKPKADSEVGMCEFEIYNSSYVQAPIASFHKLMTST